MASTTLMNPIPGSSVLGWGFDIFNTYSSRSKMQQLFLLPSTSQKTWTYGPTGIEYLLPDNIVIEEMNRSLGQSYVFSTRSGVQSHFAAKAGVEAGYGAFSGQFETSFSNTSRNDSEYSYGLYQMEFFAWKLNLQDQTTAALAPWVVNDPDYWELPSFFNEQTKPIFYRFFEKYGTHYVSSVQVGYRLYYSEAVDKSYTTDELTIKTKVDLEYRALFVKVGAEASAEWEKVGYEWTENRVASVEAQGGNSAPLDLILPAYGDNFSVALSAWRLDAERNPAAVDFELRPVWNLFSGAKADALKLAFDAYARDRIYVESKTDGSTILVVGAPQTPANPRPADTGGFQVSVLNRGTLDPVLNKYYSFPLNRYWETWPAMYASMYNDLLPHNNPSNLFLFASYGMLGVWYPTEQMYQLLLGAGASTGLSGWQQVANRNYSANYVAVNYILVGAPQAGPGTGFEAFTFASERSFIQTYTQNGQTRYYLSGRAAPVANLEVLLRDVPGGAQLSIVRATQAEVEEEPAFALTA